MGKRARSGALVPKTSFRFSCQSVCSVCRVPSLDARAGKHVVARLGTIDQLPAFADLFALRQLAAEEFGDAASAPGTLHADRLEDIGNHGLRRMAVPGVDLEFRGGRALVERNFEQTVVTVKQNQTPLLALAVGLHAAAR